MSQPTPVTPIDAEPDAVTDRIGGAKVRIDPGLRNRLMDVCDEVTDDDGERAEAGRDWWPLGIEWATRGQVPARPALVARPTDTKQVAAVLAACNEARVPVTAAGGRSGVCGASVPVFGGVSLDLCGLSGIGNVDTTSLVADLRAGTFGPEVESGLQGEHGVTLGHWPQSMDLSTVGGWLACRGAGQYSNRYGKIEDMVIGLEVVLADGTVVRTGGHAPRSATGPDLTQLFVGSEGTLGIITEGRFRVHPMPAGSGRRAFGFTSFADGLDACRHILRRGATPAVLRLYDATESGRSFEQGDTNVLIVLDEADPGLVDATLAVVDDECRNADRLDDQLVDHWLANRNDVSALAPLWRHGIVVDTVEVSARWAALPGLYRAVLDALTAIDGTLAASSHQSHAYTDGACLYFTFAGRPPDSGDAEHDAWVERYYTDAWDAVTRATISAGGAISHHHGIGINRSRFLAGALGNGFEVLSAVKQVLDPNGILNPGKLGLPSPFGELAWPVRAGSAVDPAPGARP
ncbi:MAG TPA: FAD-binding oxidoreductase [Acidimicrobiales bacterium]|nr:FAD-binding oxidoreductase [Acidimicrobiales bacterium]